MKGPRNPKAPKQTPDADEGVDGPPTKRESALIGERLDLLFEEARSYEYMVLNEADRVQMQKLLSSQARGGWEVHTFTAIPDPAYPQGRKDRQDQDPDNMENLGVIYVALMRRGGVLRKVSSSR